MAMGDGVSTMTTCIVEERGRSHTESLGMRRPSLQLTQEVIEFGLRLRRQFASRGWAHRRVRRAAGETVNAIAKSLRIDRARVQQALGRCLGRTTLKSRNEQRVRYQCQKRYQELSAALSRFEAWAATSEEGTAP